LKYTSGAAIRGSRYGNSLTAPTPVVGGVHLLRLEAAGYNGFIFTQPTGLVQFTATEAWTGTNNGTEMQFWTTPAGSNVLARRMTITDSGRIGIGTNTPQVALDVLGSDTFPNSNASAYFYAASTGLTSSYFGSFAGVTIRASGYVVGAGFAAISDARIKTIEGDSDSASDLATLKKIRITDYRYKDTTLHGAIAQKKVVAQQVEQVYPQAVSQMTDVVPDIFTTATVRDGWILLATDLARGERVRLVTRDGQQAVYEVQAVEPGRFRTDLVVPADGEVFVYGREVMDFRVVDYEAIAMLNVSATQELARRNAALEARIATLEAALKALAASAPQR
jgi:hypothetical protein